MRRTTVIGWSRRAEEDKVALEFVVADLCRAVAIRIGSAVDMDGVPEACHNLDHGLVLVDRGDAKSSGQIAEK